MLLHPLFLTQFDGSTFVLFNMAHILRAPALDSQDHRVTTFYAGFVTISFFGQGVFSVLVTGLKIYMDTLILFSQGKCKVVSLPCMKNIIKSQRSCHLQQ